MATPAPAAVAARAASTPAAIVFRCARFARSVPCMPLPKAPAVSPRSAEWAAEQAQPGRPPVLASMSVSSDPKPGDREDTSIPLYADPGPGGLVRRVRCGGVGWSESTCRVTRMAGAIVRVPRGAFAEGSGDRHFSVEDAAGRRELDFWGTEAVGDAREGELHASTAGQCPWDGDGAACSGSTATNIASSLGAIDPVTLRAVETSPHGTLPYAIATTLLCTAKTWVAPANFSDGFSTDGFPSCRDHLGPGGRPPEGTRWFLDVSDADVNATANKPYVKAILRTLDREHFGGLVTDVSWAGAPGPAFQTLRDGWGPVLREAGVPEGTYGLPMTALGIDVGRAMRFCVSGTCR